MWTCLSRLPPTSNSVVSMASAASAQAASAVSAVSGVPGFTANQSESLLAGLPHHHPALSPNFLTSPASHQEYLNAAAQRLSEMQAASALDPMNAIEGKTQSLEKRMQNSLAKLKDKLEEMFCNIFKSTVFKNTPKYHPPSIQINLLTETSFFAVASNGFITPTWFLRYETLVGIFQHCGAPGQKAVVEKKCDAPSYPI